MRDRYTQGQDDRIIRINMLAAMITLWNSSKSGDLLTQQAGKSKRLSPDLMVHISLLG